MDPNYTDPSCFEDAMAYHDTNLYSFEPDRRPSSHHTSPTMISSRRAINGMSYLHNSPSGHQRTNSNRHFIRSPETAIYEDGATPQMISPHPEQDVNHMLSQAPYAEEPRADDILNSPPQLDVPAHTVTFNTGHPSPWSAYRTEMGSDQNEFLNLSSDPRSRGAPGTARSSLSTVDTQYTASSDGRSDVSQGRTETRRGGRQPGSRLPEASVQNVRQVRDVGACFRCALSKEKCSPGTPCENCSNVKGRKWVGCIRSFSEMARLLKPVILAERLHFDNMAGWIREHASFPPGDEIFELPLNFGFGEIFEGLYGYEYNPTTNEAQRSHAVGHGDQPRLSPGIAVCPIYSSADAAQRMIWQWLKQTLTRTQSMGEWLERCSRVEWIRKLLQSTWEYSVTCWYETSHVEVEERKLDDNLLEAWMAALLVTMLALPVTIPEQIVHNIVPRLRFSRYNYPFPNTSRALSRAVKALLFDMYRQLVDRLTSALRDVERLKPEEVSDRRLGHIYCIAILVIVITGQIQTSLMDNGRLSAQQAVNPHLLWEETFEHIRGVECAFRNTIMFVKHNNAKRLKEESISDAKLLLLRQMVQETGRLYRNAIKGHRNVDLERLMRSDDPFHEANMQRVFAFFFDLVRTERPSRA